MPRRITLIDGHPDPDRERFCHALADAYAEGAAGAGHDLRRLTLADLDIPLLRSRREWEDGRPLPPVLACQEAVAAAEHLVIIYPLWLGSMPALLKSFFEQTFRPGFAIAEERMSPWPGKLTGRSARIVVTMGMPAFAYRWFYFAHSLRSLERNILRFSGIGPIRETLIGSVEASAPARAEWLARLRGFGRAGS